MLIFFNFAIISKEIFNKSPYILRRRNLSDIIYPTDFFEFSLLENYFQVKKVKLEIFKIINEEIMLDLLKNWSNDHVSWINHPCFEKIKINYKQYFIDALIYNLLQ